MDVGYIFFDILEMFISFLKTSMFTFLGYTVSLWQCLIGGIVIFLIFYIIFRVGE